MENNISFLQFVAADCGDKNLAHEFRMSMIRAQIIKGVKGNDDDWRKAMEVAKTQKTAIAKAYVRAFGVIGRITPAKYQGRCTEEIMETVVLPKVNELCEQFEITFLSALPVRKEVSKEEAAANRAAKKEKEFLAFAQENGYVKPEALSKDNAYQVIMLAIQKLERSELTRLESLIGSMLDVAGRVDTDEAEASAEAKEAKVKA